MESVTPEEFLRLIFGAIGQQRDPKEILLAGEVDRMLEQHRAVAVTLVLLMDHEVFEQNYKTTLSRADREQ